MSQFQAERTRVSAIFDSGSKVGTAFATPFVVWMMTAFGWKVPFIVSGLLGLFWVGLWYAYYRDPEKHKYTKKAELEYICEGQAQKGDSDTKPPMKWYELLKYRNVWAMSIGFFMLNCRGFQLMKMGWVSMIPPLTGLISELCAGWFSDRLYEKGHSLTFVRKLSLVGGFLLATTIAFAGLVNSAAWSIVLLSISYAGLAIAACAIWSLRVGRYCGIHSDI
jgi:MFS transporter, ACS family, D-galactonate transporter